MREFFKRVWAAWMPPIPTDKSSFKEIWMFGFSLRAFPRQMLFMAVCFVLLILVPFLYDTFTK